MDFIFGFRILLSKKKLLEFEFSCLIAKGVRQELVKNKAKSDCHQVSNSINRNSSAISRIITLKANPF